MFGWQCNKSERRYDAPIRVPLLRMLDPTDHIAKDVDGAYGSDRPDQRDKDLSIHQQRLNH